MTTGLAEGTFGLGMVASAPGQKAFPALVHDDGRALDLTSLDGGPESVSELLEGWEQGWPLVRDAAERPAGLTVDDLHLTAPVSPRQIWQSGANYYQHVLGLIIGEARTAGADADQAEREARQIMDERVTKGDPYVFIGAPSAICGPFDDVVLPRWGAKHDWELELAAVLDERGEPSAYLIVNDLTTRDLVFRPDLKAIGSDWMRSKNAPTFLPTGPFVVPSHFVDPSDLRIELSLDGETMQDESTADMIFDVAILVRYLRERVSALPGDLLLTGSPAGNGAQFGRFLEVGSVMSASITGLGRQRNRCVRAEG